MGFRNDLQKNILVKKKTFENTSKIHLGNKSVWIFYIEILIFLFRNTFNYFINYTLITETSDQALPSGIHPLIQN